MALAQHKSLDIRYRQQVDNSREYLVPFIERRLNIGPDTHVLEIGCAEGGVLRPFLEAGASIAGVDLSPARVATAKENFKEEIAQGRAEFVAQNVYEEAFLSKHKGRYDLILLKDTIEHIPDQEKFIPYLKNFLKPEGKIFFGFPPWRMPFGGHQQTNKNKFLAMLPWYHLFPRSIYSAILKAGGETDKQVEDMLEIKDTGINLGRFEKILKQDNWEVLERTLFLFNPIYRYKFGLTPREQFPILGDIPFVRDFVTTAGWYLVSPRK
ncbi:class I SAM-dependent methyltransferase [Pontibacter sp. G13]|uniref:class I SAM-dependent methyltransferase n=1 Tax=Pontibacter sp. G13 TaxID=3074898 RepID=UPI00288AA29A|nr:class I SAM-dependent methyltransferase [Pontibacter sp. G13]WNJ16367.1 class I SAM-dependent methyltransferase [Pontibacter sp. G13]